MRCRCANRWFNNFRHICNLLLNTRNSSNTIFNSLETRSSIGTTSGFMQFSHGKLGAKFFLRRLSISGHITKR